MVPGHPLGVEAGKDKVRDGRTKKDGGDREEEEAHCGDGHQGGEMWGRGEVGCRQRREGFMVVLDRRRGLIATDEELGGAPSEGVDEASSSFPSITNRGLSNQ